MTLTYIFHSGFVLETEQSSLVFDYWLDPIDGRVGNGYTLVARQFIERFKVGLFVPMHFTTGFESAWRFQEFADEKRVPFWEINREGETIEI